MYGSLLRNPLEYFAPFSGFSSLKSLAGRDLVLFQSITLPKAAPFRRASPIASL